MSIHVKLHHLTRYRYDRLVTLTPQIVRLRPAPHSRTPVRSYALRVEPRPHFVNWQQDPQANWLARVVFPERVDHLQIEVDLVAELSVQNPFDFFLEPEAEQFPFAYAPWLERELRPFRELAAPGPLLSRRLATVDRTPRRTVDFLVDLNRELAADVRYLIRLEPGVQDCEDTLERGSGSCRDSAWLLVRMLRELGFAARFVSGYLIQLEPDQRPVEGAAGAERDFTDLHAWVEAYLPGAGWVGLDPTSGMFAAEGHIPLAATPDPSSAAPITGGVEDCEVEFDFAMEVTRVHEDPRVTKPYDDATWERIAALGDRVDEDLHRGDVRLTMGGEPTFVSALDMDGAEWTRAALGPAKRELGESLLRRMADRLAPGGLLHFGQGKWYPGEPLPRWALTCWWRRDGVPIWREPKWLADTSKPGSCTAADAEAFARAVAQRLAVDPDHVMLAFEDPWESVRAEGRLPVNIEAGDPRLDDPDERVKLRGLVERGLSTPAGAVLPLSRASGARGPAWQSGLWMLRARHLTLIPGDSPIGLRLPLASLPWQSPELRSEVWPIDPLAEREPLPSHPEPVQDRIVSAPPYRTAHVNEQGVRTALCVEERGGHLHVFMPPLESANDYLDLCTAIEDTARTTDRPVVIEGYPMPFDPRIEKMSVTPDPGVLEVNVRPATGWRELVEHTTQLYADARALHLSTEKFMLDGRHSGTGGGNHVVLGGPSPADSPFLRRPDLLRSLVGYWLNHPSLSYLFSGLFIGPTSQAPRVDEGRQDSVYELAIAFRQIDGARDCPPWLVDRVFRNLLTDVTGNTHRAEFCIDKLYAPESATGRLGLVELRAFEMPPHARMSLAQQLLVRALVARFWREPYRERPVRWGAQLHDRFLLPHFLDEDFRLVLEELARVGYRFERTWFDTHFEFRFAKIGTVAAHGVELELRHAIEPWHVLGEEPGAGGTVRYVDSSVERLQVRARGLIGERSVLACNGRRVPLHPTGAPGEFVAGVRYRAWQPPACLHPTIPVHAPLVFDLIDTALGGSLGGCTYHVAHPGGRSYDTFPVNAYEAEARRGARFEAFGHTPGAIPVPAPEHNPQHPLTLDLRWEGA
jgi:uncharacterized protein (DUF2126 family)/transglutaminase-like putative cysteine protease